MKKILLIMPFLLFANQAVPMPPMPPSLNLTNKKKSENVMPKECQVIPPMIIFLPPPLEVALRDCKNKLFMPKKDYVNKVFAKKHLKVKSIEIVKGFNQLYKITTDKKTFYCNKDLSKCFEIKGE